jgi:uncharacterized protein involved in cysteine biosynthesis
MKSIITIFVFVALCATGFYLDQKFVEIIMGKVPQTEWRDIIEIIVWLFVLGITLSLILSVSALISTLFYIAIGADKPRLDGRIKSRWQQRLDQAMKERDLKG